MDEAPIPLLIALSVLLALAVGCIIYLITRIQALKQRVSEADIRQMVDMGEEKGAIEPAKSRRRSGSSLRMSLSSTTPPPPR